MKLSDSIKYSFTKTIRDKKNIYFIIIFSICSILMMGTIIFLDLKYRSMDYEIEKDIGFRSLYVYANGEEIEEHYKDEDYDYGFDKILDIDHVIDIMDSELSGFSITTEELKDEKYDGYLLLKYGANSVIPKVVEGITFNENDSGVAICPLNLYPSLTYDAKTLKKEDFLDGKKYLNKSFKIKLEEKDEDNGKIFKTGNIYEKEYKIIGLYNNQDNDSEPNVCYITPRDSKELYDSTYKKANKNNIKPKLVIVDSPKNKQDVMNQLIELGFEPEIKTYFDYEAVNQTGVVCVLIITFAISTVIILVLIYIKKINNESSFQQGILKSIGYQNNEIKRIVTIQLVIQILISYIISVILILLIITFISKRYEGYLIYKNFNLNYNLFIYLLSLIALLFISISISYLYTSSKLKNTTNKLFAEKG